MDQTLSNTVTRKAELRRLAIAQRDLLSSEKRNLASASIASLCLQQFFLPLSISVSAFWPMGSEVDCKELIHSLHHSGHKVGLPMVAGKGKPLLFRCWHPEQKMKEGVLGIHTPPEDAPLLEPDLLFVPMLAFDRQGYRLGYGGGFYDRTLAFLRAHRPVTAIGVAYTEQEVTALPHDSFDAKLDFIVTEKETIRINQ